jgi:isopentenyl-diphosphate delta-isomerase
MINPHVILVDKNDHPLGIMDKLEAHEKGLLHRAFSVFVFNDQGQLMIHQRALSKYHSPGLWTNTCCSHQQMGETSQEAAHRRLVEEMGFDCDLEEIFEFVYRAEFSNGLTEYEYDHVFIGHFNDLPNINPEEVNTWKWISPKALAKDLDLNPQNYTEWFKLSWERVLQYQLEKAA